MDERELSIIQAIGEEVREILIEVKSQLENSVTQLVTEAVQKAVAGLPTPVVPELPDVPQLVTEAVQKAVAGLPAPVVPELPDVPKLVTETVQKAVAALPTPAPALDGRDALQLEILPCIDEKKSYARGTYATHDGGLWRTYEKSHGLHGWECIVDGVASTEVKQTDPRSFSVAVTRASGATEEKTFSIPTMIYKGVFNAGESYLPGDTVTWGGSLWHCDEPTADKPGEVGSKGWTLAAKRGRDARG
ncbi:phage portal protein [Salmonella enterica subsp. enterica]|nr:phage portal protein [Salmonella enterica subsp. enterica serovar Enteritidis]